MTLTKAILQSTTKFMKMNVIKMDRTIFKNRLILGDFDFQIS